MEDLVRKLHPLERNVLPFLDKCTSNLDLVEKTGMQDVEVTRALQWLSNKGVIKIDKKEEQFVSLDKNGKIYLEQGLPERQFLKALEKEGELALDEIKGKSGLSQQEISISMGQLKKQGLIDVKKEEDEIFVTITEEGKKKLFEDSPEEQLLQKELPISLDSLSKEERKTVKDLLKRRQIIKVEKKVATHYSVTDKGHKLLDHDFEDKKFLEKLTSEMLKTGKWKGKDFRAYDVTINVPKLSYGKKHMVTEAVDYVRRIWLDMGFKEMRGPLTQTAFWDLDALFVPQDHPAREMQDTFYLEEPAKGKLPPFWNKVKEVHENGGDTGSKGWGGKWSKSVAEQMMLITHDTYLSAQVLSNIKKEDLPVKTFQIMKVFRNEAADWKHLFEFHQVGGIVVDPDANFRNLIGYLRRFFRKMGYPDVRVRPAHFPYTEPSAEVDVYDPKKKQWIELVGSGVFRPEMVKPLLGFDCPVLAWGIGLERIITDYHNIADLRDIYKNDLKMLKNTKKFMK